MRSVKTRHQSLVLGIIFLVICFYSSSSIGQTQKPYRAIAGMSMGAYGALSYGLKYPDKFQVLAGLGGPVDMRGLLSFASRTMSNYGDWESQYFTINDLLSMVLDLSISYGNIFYEGTENLIPELGKIHHCRYACEGNHLMVPAIMDDWDIPNMLAVDLNDNEVFDYGEPLVHQMYEPFMNIDSNGWWDSYEPFDDVGLDGIAGTQDYGEGNGKWDVDPDIETLLAQDPYILLDNAPDEVLAGLNLYIDSGYNDDFDFNELNDRFADLISSRDESFSTIEYTFWFNPAFDERHAYFRYYGDHLGLPNPLILKRRFSNLFKFVAQKLPGGEYANLIDFFFPSTLEINTIESEALGREGRYGIYLPPGYKLRKKESYSTIYFLTGYGSRLENFIGMGIKTLIDTLLFSREFEKIIIVFLDGRSENGLGGKSSFYVNQVHPDGEAWEDYLTEVIDHVDKTYKTRKLKPKDMKWY
jgi:pimeloyl-ACP methyl ester carboxylesterase